MADLERSAKRVSQWTNNELLAFNIRVEDAGVEAFFDIPQLPPPTASATILDNLDQPPGPLFNNDRLFFAYKHLAEGPLSCIDFTMFLLNLLEYANVGHRMLNVWAKLPFLMAGRRIIANIDLFLIDVAEPKEYLLIFHEDKVGCLNHTFLRLTVLSPALKPKSRSTSHCEGNRRLPPQQL
jgi:hypothetical protein